MQKANTHSTVVKDVQQDAQAAQRILAHLPAQTQAFVAEITVHSCLASSNDYLMQKPLPQCEDLFDLCFAYRQTQGKGQYGRQWYSPQGGVYGSLRACGNAPESNWLGLLVASELSSQLRQLGIADSGVKWPNDIYCTAGKLAGILVERKHRRLVVGIGLNRFCPNLNDYPHATGLDKIYGVLPYWRTAGIVAQALIDGMKTFLDRTPNEFLQRYQQFDFLANKPLKFLSQDKTIYGLAQGLSAQGHLRIAHDGTVHTYGVGEVKIIL